MGVILDPCNGIGEKRIRVVSKVVHDLLAGKDHDPARIRVES